MAGYPVVKAIHVKDNPFSVTVDMTGKAPVKVIRVGEREVLVAIKNVSLAKGLVVGGKDNSNLESVHVETLEGNVVAVMVTGKHVSEKKINSSFNAAKNQLTVVLNKAAKFPPPVPKSIPVPQPVTIQKPSTPDVTKPEKQAMAPVIESSEKPPVSDDPNEPAEQEPAPRPQTKPTPKAPPASVPKKENSLTKGNEKI